MVIYTNSLKTFTNCFIPSSKTIFLLFPFNYCIIWVWAWPYLFCFLFIWTGIGKSCIFPKNINFWLFAFWWLTNCIKCCESTVHRVIGSWSRNWRISLLLLLFFKWMLFLPLWIKCFILSYFYDLIMRIMTSSSWKSTWILING